MRLDEESPAAMMRMLVRSDAEALSALFTSNDVASVRRMFDPFMLSKQTALDLTQSPGQDRYYGAWVDGLLVGFSMLRGWNEGYEVPSFGILVDAVHTGRGLGRLLTEFTVDQARDLGCERVRLTVYADNLHAVRLYTSLGFAETSRARNTSGRESLHLELALRPARDAAAALVPVAAPSLIGNELAYVQDCLQSTWISSIGKYIDRFEREFAAFCEVDHAVACCNGTAALHLALLAADAGPGDEVIVPTLAFIACANAIVQCGAVPVLVDCDEVTWNMDPDAVAGAVTGRTRAILAVHLYGHPADMNALRVISDRHGLTLIEDAAEAHGARYHGRIAGSLGDIATFSFFGNKILTTGEGGMVTTNDALVAERVRLLRGQGQDPHRRYWHIVRGFNYRMTNVAAAIGVAQLEQAELHTQRRQLVAGWYHEALADVDGITLAPKAAWAKPAYWMIAAHVAEADRDELMSAMAFDGIETRPAFHPLHTLPIYTELDVPGKFPIAEELGARVICLPSSGNLDRATVQRVAGSIRKALAVASRASHG